MASRPNSVENTVLLETDSVFALSVDDSLHSNLHALIQHAQTHQIQLKIPNTALWEFNVVLLSQGKLLNDVINALVLVKAEITKLGIEEYSTELEDLILANKLRAEFHQLTFFDSLHVAAARRVGLSLISSDNVCQKLFGNVVAFEDFLKAPT